MFSGGGMSKNMKMLLGAVVLVAVVVAVMYFTKMGPFKEGMYPGGKSLNTDSAEPHRGSGGAELTTGYSISS